MGKILLIMMLGLGLTDLAGANPVEFGVRAGTTMANLVYPTPLQGINTDVLFGITCGLFVEAGLNDFLSIQPEANLTTKGIQVNAPPEPIINQYGQIVGEVSGGSFSVSYNYLEFPVFLKAHTSLGPQVIGSLSAGPSVGILLNANEHYSISGITGNTTLNAAGLDWGIMFGTGIELDRFLLDIRYDLGLTSIAPNGGRGPINSVLSMEAGYRIF